MWVYIRDKKRVSMDNYSITKPLIQFLQGQNCKPSRLQLEFFMLGCVKCELNLHFFQKSWETYKWEDT